MAQVVIAVRGGPSAKSRCARRLSPADRAQLTAVMLTDMLTAAARTPGVSRVWVVTPTAHLAALAQALGATVIVQRPPETLNAAFDAALSAIGELSPGALTALLPGDLPLLAPRELAAAIALARAHAIVLVRARDGGTGALLVRAGDRFAPRFGPDSFRRHVRLARALDRAPAVFEGPSMSLDVDRPDDLLAVLEQGPTTNTAAFLSERLQTRILA